MSPYDLELIRRSFHQTKGITHRIPTTTFVPSISIYGCLPATGDVKSLSAVPCQPPLSRAFKKYSKTSRTSASASIFGAMPF